MYASLIPYFECIFPINDHQRSLLRSIICDVGFGSGTLLRFLASEHADVYGLEYDAALIRHVQGSLLLPDYKLGLGSLEEIDTLFTGRTFDLIICIGNTLPHVPSSKQNQFIKNTNIVTHPGSCLVIATVNYDRILAEKPDKLPDIQRSFEGKQLSFSRHYSYKTDSIAFSTSLSLEGEILKQDSVTLYPCKKDDVAGWLRSSGYGRIEIYGGYDQSQWTLESFHTVYVAYK
ncbi:hypothetical protein GEMRC1_004654 [Eukaryota sp. GEM-RC1]